MLPHIGLVAPARSGKDSVGALLVQLEGYTRVAFADAVRESLLAINPYMSVVYPFDKACPESLSELVSEHGWDAVKDGILKCDARPGYSVELYPRDQARRMLQAHGDTTRRILGPAAWLHVGMAKAAAAGGPCVFTDVRYRNEATAIRNGGGLIVRVARPGFEAFPGGHVSETELMDYRSDLTILNDGTLTELHVKVQRLMELVRERRRLYAGGLA